MTDFRRICGLDESVSSLSVHGELGGISLPPRRLSKCEIVR